MVRTRDELADAIESNPLPDGPRVPKHFQVSFLAATARPEVVATLRSADWGDDQIAFRGREIYAFYAGGMQKSRLARRLAGAQLGVTATARNWNTVTRLLELADS